MENTVFAAKIEDLNADPVQVTYRGLGTPLTGWPVRVSQALTHFLSADQLARYLTERFYQEWPAEAQLVGAERVLSATLAAFDDPLLGRLSRLA